MPRSKRSLLSLAHSLAPFGTGHVKPKHYRAMLRVAWENRGSWRYAWRVLTRGVCDGCALGTTGLRDWTIDGIHLCMVRLELLRLNTMGAMDHALLTNAQELAKKPSAELRDLGRLAYPMRRRRGERGFTRVTFDEVWHEVGELWRQFDPARTAMYLTSRGITNEVYYVAQKVMRFLGSNSIDNSARLCHSPSTAGLKSTIGVAATTCSYRDWFDTDLIVFFGSNPANDQPVTMKYLLEARKRGVRVLAVNAMREAGMRRYWVPSTATSALLGTKITDRFFLVRAGNDIAFLNAVAKVVLDKGWHKREFIEHSTVGLAQFRRSLAEQPMDELLSRSASTLEDVEAFARELAEADKAVFVWSMGITQHAHGTDNVRAIVNLGLLREYVGRPGTGLMPIRGHSGVQGGAEMGAYASVFPGGLPINEENARHLSELWGFDVPDSKGLSTSQALEAAHRGEVDGLYVIGGNFLETMPAPERVREALANVALRLHSDIVVTSQMLVAPADVVYLLPARTRYEQKDGGTETTTERRVIFSPNIPGHDIGEARSEWEMLVDFAKAVKPKGAERVAFSCGADIRREIARAIPAYAGIDKLEKRGDQFQWGGPRLCEDRAFPTSDGKAHFNPVMPPAAELAGSEFILTTRRGKQFNSMIQGNRDPLTGADRDHILIAPEDATRLGLEAGGRIWLENEWGTFAGRAFVTEVAQGTLLGHWPEVNVLLPPSVCDPHGGIPDYTARVRARKEGR